MAVRPPGELLPEGFALSVTGEKVSVTGGDAVGAMYGLLELAEQVRNGGGQGSWSRVVGTLSSTTQRPFLEYRADNAFIDCTDRSLAFDVPMWKAYIDQLARSRFNWLDLHGGYDLRTTGHPNLLPLLVHVPEYPKVGRKSQQRRNLADLKTILAYARSRGVRVALMNYSVGGLAPRGEPLADYTARAVARLLRDLPELTMLGFRIGETGQPADFFQRAYLKGIRLSRRNDVRLYTRSWQTDQKRLEAIGRASGGYLDIEIKYNGEQLGLPYQAIGKGGGSYSYQGYVKPDAPYRIIWQVRANGTHRFWCWGDTGFVRRAVESFRFGRARGFTLEPHIASFSTQAASYYRSPNDQSVYRYIWEKHWMWYFLWGRLSYNPQLPEATLVAAFQQHFGPQGKIVYEAMQASGPIVPLVCAYRYQGPDQRDWSPETETGCLANRGPDWNRKTLEERARQIGTSDRDSFDLLSYAAHPPMDPSAFAGVRDFVKARLKHEPDGRVGPALMAQILSEAAASTREAVARVGPLHGRAADEWRLLKTDLLCASHLADFHAARIRGVTHLSYALAAGSAADYEQALGYLERSRESWQRLAETADAVYAPLDNPQRHESKFRWSLPLPVLERLDATAPLLWAGRKAHPGARRLEFTAADEGREPGIEVTGVRPAVQAGQAQVSCHVSTSAGIGAVWLWHRKLPSESVWEKVLMAPGGGSQFSAAFPVTREGALYFVEVEDPAGQARNFPEVLKTRPYWVIDPWEIQNASREGNQAALGRRVSESSVRSRSTFAGSKTPR